MDKMVIHGGKRLVGEVTNSGAKNAALPIMAAALLTAGCNILHGVPDLADIKTISQLLASIGVKVERGEVVEVDATTICSVEASYDLVRTMRASILVLGPLVARMGEARVSLPEGVPLVLAQ